MALVYVDREHVANLVMGFELERGWGISARVLYQSGTPQTPNFTHWKTQSVAHRLRVSIFDLIVESFTLQGHWSFTSLLEMRLSQQTHSVKRTKMHRATSSR